VRNAYTILVGYLKGQDSKGNIGMYGMTMLQVLQDLIQEC